MVGIASTLDRDTIVRELNDLIHLDFDAASAYESAIEHIENESLRQRLDTFHADHDRHTRLLADAVRRFEGMPANAGDFRKVLTKGKVLLASLGSDATILDALRANAEQTNAGYEKAIQTLASEPTLADLLRANMDDARRQRQWLDATLDASP